LLQARQRKMPYKHIAAHLNKTELACRLHYHQLSHGSNRRKRRGSAAAPAGPAHGHPPMTPTALNRRYDPMEDVSAPSTPKAQSPSTTYAPVSPQSAKSVAFHETIDAASPPSSAKSLMMRPSNVNLQPVSGGLRVECKPRPAPIDRDRLRSIYDAHKVDFWGKIAHEYMPGTDPRSIEDAWKSAFAFPLTPAVSPDNKPLHTATGAGLDPSPFPSHYSNSSFTAIGHRSDSISGRRFSVPGPLLRRLSLTSSTVPPTPATASYHHSHFSSSAHPTPTSSISALLSHPSTPHARDLPPPTPSRALDSPINFFNANPFAASSSKASAVTASIKTPSPPPERIDDAERERHMAETTLPPLRESVFVAAAAAEAEAGSPRHGTASTMEPRGDFGRER
jgi:hypothetical protein